MRDQATAFGPATVANVAAGFDVLGFCVSATGDTVHVQRRQRDRAILIEDIDAVDAKSRALPREPDKNTATAGLLQMQADLQLDFGFALRIEKGIPIGSGMGGSAASAVAAVVAANALLDQPLDEEQILLYSLIGESASTGVRHPDNVAPCLQGGLVGCHGHGPQLRIYELPWPEQLRCVLLREPISILTRDARRVLEAGFSTTEVTTQLGHLAAFVHACHSDDLDLLARSLRDVIAEPRRASLVPNLKAIQQAALDQGALGCSFAGSGPTIFAWCIGDEQAEVVERSMREASSFAPEEIWSWRGPLHQQGAALVES